MLQRRIRSIVGGGCLEVNRPRLRPTTTQQVLRAYVSSSSDRMDVASAIDMRRVFSSMGGTESRTPRSD
jgi:hypothetical protein